MLYMILIAEYKLIIKYRLIQNAYGKVTEYGQCPNTETLGISESINPTTKCINE